MGNTSQLFSSPDGTFTLPDAGLTLAAMSEAVHTRPIYAVRWEAFRALLKARRMTITAAADLLGKGQGQVSHFGGKVPTKIIGDQIAAEIEAAFGLPPGYLDERQDSVKLGGADPRQASQNETLDPAILAEAEKWMRFVEKASGELRPVRRAERLIDLYRLVATDGGSLSPEHAQELIEAARQGDTKRGRTTAGVGA